MRAPIRYMPDLDYQALGIGIALFTGIILIIIWFLRE